MTCKLKDLYYASNARIPIVAMFVNDTRYMVYVCIDILQ